MKISESSRVLLFLSGIIILIGGIYLFSLSSLRGDQPHLSESKDDVIYKPSDPYVIATIFPIAQIAGAVGGSDIELEIATPYGTEPHEYEPTPSKIARFSKADLLLTIGGDIDPWSSDLSPDSVATEIVSLQNGDPHVWLDAEKVSLIAENYAKLFIALNPSKESNYLKNLVAFKAELANIDDAYESGLASCTHRDLIVAHDAYEYLAARYGLTTHAITGLSPEDEPSPQTIADLITLVKATGLTTVFTEALLPPELSATIASESGAQLAVLSPIENIEEGSTDTYLSLMRFNLDALRKALNCK